MKKTIKNIFRWGGVEVKGYNRRLRDFRKRFKKFRKYSMVPEAAFVKTLELCDHYRDLSGDYVECGVWRGGLSAAIAETLNDNRTFHLFDSFEGLPPAQEIDGPQALAWQKDTTAPGYHDNCKAEETYAIEAMHAASYQDYKIYKGWFNETLPHFAGNKIAILHLDADWYDSVMMCLEVLYPRVVDGGIIIIDDYYIWDGCSRAVHDYLSKIKSTTRVHQWNNTVAYIIKKD